MARTGLGAVAVEGETVGDVLDTDAAGGILIRGGVVRFASYGGVVALSALSAALLTRHLADRFGQYTTVTSLVAVVAVVTDAGMSNIGVREYALLSGEAREALMRSLLGLRILLTLIGVALASAFAIVAGYYEALLLGTIVAGVGTVALVVQHSLSIPLSTELRLGTLSLFDLARQALTVAAIVGLIALGAGVLPLLAVSLAVNVLLIPVTAYLVRGKISARPAFRPREWGALLRLTVTFSLATAVGTIYVYTAQILTSLVIGAHASSVFAVSFRIFIVAGGVPGLLVSAALPLLSRAARDDAVRLAYGLQRIFETSLIGGAGVVLGLVAGAHFIVSVIGSSKFAGATSVLQIQSFALLASYVLSGWGFALVSLRLQKQMLFANLAALVASCALTLVLAEADGADGAALATVLAETTLGAGYLIALVWGRPQYRPKITVIAKVLVAAAPAAALALIPEMPSLVRALVAVTVYALLILASGALPDEIVDALPIRRARAS
jgi:O-antigen/teichoic acid export membrane protein